MLAISSDVKETLKESLDAYYTSMNEGDLIRFSSLMTKESYLLTLSTLGFKKAFKDESFKHLLEEMEHDPKSLLEVENLLSYDLKTEARINFIELLSYETKGSDRVTVHYTQDKHIKKIYFSNQDGSWKINLKAGRQKDS